MIVGKPAREVLVARGSELNNTDKLHKCEQYPWTFYLKASFTDHINEVHKKNHECEECGYAANAGNLKVHMNAVHKKIKNHVCDECG